MSSEEEYTDDEYMDEWNDPFEVKKNHRRRLRYCN